jgi:hypothetical protein
VKKCVKKMSGKTQDETYEIFCFMVIEEFLMKKNMHDSLRSFRSEWKRPAEDVTLLSWYEVALKLRLPDLVGADSANKCVLSNLVHALVQESSIRSRRPAEVTVTGLASLPRITSVSNTNAVAASRDSAFGYQANVEKDAFITSHQLFQKNKPAEDSNQKGTQMVTGKKSSPRRSSPRKPRIRMSTETSAVVQKHIDALTGDKFAKTKLSVENWIPDLLRRQSIEREIQVVKETTRDWENVERMQDRQLKDILKSDVERAKMEKRIKFFERMERREHVPDIPCGCCRVEFLAVNLPLKVSQKAIIDFRIKVKGQLNSFSVFGRIKPSSDDRKEDGDYGKKSAVSYEKDLSDIETENHARRYSVVPRCYDEVAVCSFCSQFFEHPEEYRPTFQKIYHDERVAHDRELKRIEEEYWDPLKMSEKFRELEEKQLLAKMREEDEAAGRPFIEERTVTAPADIVSSGILAGPVAAINESGVDANASDFELPGSV